MSKKRRRRRRRKKKKRGGGSSDLGNLQGMSPRAMQQALGNIDTNEIDGVEEVIVKTKDEEIVLKQPEVTIMNMGQEIWNIVPQQVNRRPRGSSSDSDSEPQPAKEVKVKDSDVDIIVNTAGVSREEAIEAIKKSGGDIAKAIKTLK